jgi:hypothetical protein
VFPSITSLPNIYIRFVEFDVKEVRYRGKWDIKVSKKSNRR